LQNHNPNPKKRKEKKKGVRSSTLNETKADRNRGEKKWERNFPPPLSVSLSLCNLKDSKNGGLEGERDRDRERREGANRVTEKGRKKN